MALPIVQIPPLDPYGFTGPTRVMSGVGRSGNVVLDTPYGDPGVPEYARWIYVGITGDLSIIKWDGTTQVYENMLGGYYPIYSKQVNSVGTTATGLVWGS